MRKRVEQADQIIANIRAFQREVAASSALQSRLSQVHAWYACKLAEDGEWLFGPSKFVGYQDNTAKQYLAESRNGADGRETEKALEGFARIADPESRLGRELHLALKAFLATWSRTPRKGVRISIVDSGVPHSRSEPPPALDRIYSNPEICGGRPVIKGTRMRVTDIISMLASGASSDEILNDFSYLTHEDIAAALAYAAKASDHRVIHAA